MRWPNQRRRTDLERAMTSTRRYSPKMLLGRLMEQKVKQVCEASSIDPKEREAALIERLLSEHARRRRRTSF